MDPVADTPRPLTTEEIERVLSAIPYPHAVTMSHATFAREQLITILRAELMSIEITPLGIDELIERLVTQFEESRVKPGSMVGFAAAESNGTRFQQDTLSAVHKAGQAGMRGTGGAVGRIMDLVSKQQSKAPSVYDACRVYFRDIQTQQSIMHLKRPDMVAVGISALLRVEEPYTIEYHSVLFPDKKLPDWYGVYSKLYGVPIPDINQRDSSKLLRLNLDVERVVEYRVLVSELRRALLSSNTRVARFFVSPMHLGIVDVWALDQELHSYGFDISGDIELDAFNFLYGFAAKLGELPVKGIPGIRDVRAEKFDIWLIMTQGQSNRKLHDNVYEYRLSSIWPLRFGWDRPRLMWDFVGVTVIDYDKDASGWVILDGGDKGAPHDLIRIAITEDEADSRSYQNSAVATGKMIVTRPTTPANMTYWSQLWFADTDGTNLRELIVRDDVDPRFTISNRPFEVLEIYGIVAARRVMLEELYKAYGDGREKPVYSERHYSLLTDFVCHTGLIRPVSNLMIQDRSTLSKATFARQFNTLVGPAIHGVDEPIGDVSAAIMVAAKARIGPRAFEHDAVINEGITAEAIKDALRSGSQSVGEIDKMIASLTDTADVPLFHWGKEGGTGDDGDDDEEKDNLEEEIVREYEVANFPPGIDGDEGEPDEDGVAAPRSGRRRDDDLMIDDDLDDDVDFGKPVDDKDDETKPSRSTARRRTTAPRRSTARRTKVPGAVVMSPALSQAVTAMGGTLGAGVELVAPKPVCPVPRGDSADTVRRSSLRKPTGAAADAGLPPRSSRDKARLTFVDDGPDQ